MSIEEQQVSEQLQELNSIKSGTSAGFASLGKCLQQARIKAGFSVAQIASEMHLDSRFIECMESDRFKDLGAPVFVKGHLRRYARLVNIDAAMLQGLIDSLNSLPVAADPIPVSMNSIPEPRTLIPNWALWTAASVFAVISVITMVGRINFSSQLTASVPAVSVTPVQIKPQSLSAQTPSVQSSPVAMAQPLTPDKTSIVLASVTPMSTANARESDEVRTSQALAPGQVALTLRYTGDSWVEVYDANKHLVYQEMGHNNVVRQVKALAPLRVVFGSAPQVNLEVNGRSVAVPAKRVVSSVARFNVDSTGLIK